MGADGRHGPFWQGPGDEPRPHRRFYTGVLFAPDVLETEQLLHPLEDEFHLPTRPIEAQEVGWWPGGGAQRP
jgi:hypothetical protein